MKRISFFFVMLVAAVAVLAGCDGDRRIHEKNLPDAAKSFISLYFPDQTVLHAEKDNDDGERSYSVTLSDGTEIDFDESGNWTGVDCVYSEVPSGIIPAAVMADFSARFPGAGIFKIEKEPGGYELETDSGLKVVYNANGEYVRDYTDR